MTLSARPLVVLVDDDAAERKALGRVLHAGGFDHAAYASAEEFLGSPPPQTPVCFLLDVQLEGMTGLELQAHLNSTGSTVPIIIITGLEDADVRRQAERSGCIAYFRKPFEGRQVLEAVRGRIAR